MFCILELSGAKKRSRLPPCRQETLHDIPQKFKAQTCSFPNEQPEAHDVPFKAEFMFMEVLKVRWYRVWCAQHRTFI